MKSGSLVGLATLLSAAAGANGAITIGASNVAFVDISSTGTALASVSDDSEHSFVPTGFGGNDLLAGGVMIRVGNNGAVIWGTSATDTFANADQAGWSNPNVGNTGRLTMGSMPSSGSDNTFGNGGGIRQFLAPLWDDNTPGTGGGIRWQVIAGDLIVQWSNQDHFNASGAGVITYQMIVRGGVTIGSGASLVDFVYNDTLYAASQYQNDGGSASIGYKNWGVNANANDVEYGTSGGNGTGTTDPAFGGIGMQPKVAGWLSNGDADGRLTHSVSITGIPGPGASALLGLGGLVALRRRRA